MALPSLSYQAVWIWSVLIWHWSYMLCALCSMLNIRGRSRWASELDAGSWRGQDADGFSRGCEWAYACLWFKKTHQRVSWSSICIETWDFFFHFKAQKRGKKGGVSSKKKMIMLKKRSKLTIRQKNRRVLVVTTSLHPWQSTVDVTVAVFTKVVVVGPGQPHLLSNMGRVAIPFFWGQLAGEEGNLEWESDGWMDGWMSDEYE